MLSKLSVKKPYTIVVAVALIIILGVVSFSNMTTDLLPSMNLPYAMIMTTYGGASPETVEETVTKPIESAMATVSNIEEIQSVSSENMSMVILQFSQTTNMDSVSIEMRENLDQISGYWDDSVGKPLIIKLNPDMMPIMISAVQKDGLEGVEIADYVNDNILSDVESIEGVASVSTSGAIEESVQVVIRQEKIDATNEKIQNALNGQFEEQEQELADAQEELDQGKAELEDGQQQLQDGQNEAAAQIGAGSGQLSQAQSELTKTAVEIDIQLQLLAERQTELNTQKTLLDTTETTLKTTIDQLNEAKAQLSAAIQGQAQLEEALVQAQAGVTQLENLVAQLQSQLDAMGDTPTNGMTQEQWDAAKVQLQGQIDTAQAQLTAARESVASLEQQLAALQTQIGSSSEETIDQGLQAANEGLAQIQSAKAQLEVGQAQLTAGIQQLNQAKEQVASGQSQMTAAQVQLETQKILGSIELSSAASQIAMGQAQLESAQAQLDAGREQLEDAKEQALEAADVSKTITSAMVSQILMAENFSMPAGYITEEGTEYLIRVGDQFKTTQDMANLVLFNMDIDGLDPIRLSDVADVIVTDNSAEVYATINGHPGVLLTMQKQTGYSTGEVVDRLKAYFDRITEEDTGLHVTDLMDQGIYIDMIVNSVLQNLLLGGLLAIVILFLFLKDIRPTAVIACSIPISLMAAIVLMYFSGVTLNIISLSGLALGVGMLVDNSVVVIENIYRLRSQGVPAMKAAVAGAKQVTGAIVASTLTTVCVFLPIVFMEGITRQLFVDMGLTIAYSLLASLVIAITLVPMMSSGVLKNVKEKDHPWFDKVRAVYEKALGVILGHKWIVLIGSVVMLVASIFIALARGTAFMPEMESTQMSMTATLEDTATVEETGAMADQIAERLLTYEDVTDIGAMVGGGSTSSMLGMGSSASNQATIYIILDEHKRNTNEELAKQMQADLADLDCEISISTSNMDMSALGGSGITVEIKGRDLDKLQELARDTAEVVAQVEGTVDVSDGLEETSQELRIVVNKSTAMQHNLTVAQVYQQVAAKIAESTTSTTLSTDTKDYQVSIVNDATETFDREAIKNMTLSVTDQQGNTEEVPIGDLVEFVDASSPQSINRDAQTRYINVVAGIDADHNIGLVADDVEEALQQISLPEGYSMEMVGEDETINEAIEDVLLMMLLAVIFMYLIMVAQFQSLLSPFIVMFTIPLAFTGGFLGLIVTRSEVSVIALLGFVMLAGIIVNNGIVLVDYVNQLRGAGMEKRQALIQAGSTRMRPILMTAFTTILGLSTMAFGMGMGSDMVQPMAIVTIGGLLYGTLLTLFVVPCIYDVLNRKEYKVLKDEDLELNDEDLELAKEEYELLGIQLEQEAEPVKNDQNSSETAEVAGTDKLTASSENDMLDE